MSRLATTAAIIAVGGYGRYLFASEILKPKKLLLQKQENKAIDSNNLRGF